MSDNRKRINSVIKKLSGGSNSNDLTSILKKMDWPIEIFFISLTSEILNELTAISDGIISNNSFFISFDTSFLYQMINIFNSIKKFDKKITKEITDYIINQDNIKKIFLIMITINSNNNNEKNNEKLIVFNTNIVNLIITILNAETKIIHEIAALYEKKNEKIFDDLFLFLSNNEYTRNLLYELEKNICIYYPNIKSFKKNINYTIQYISKEYNFNNINSVKEEIKIILLIYKNDIDIISNSISELLIKIFEDYEKFPTKNSTMLFKYCFNNIVFTQNKKYNLEFMNFLFQIYNELINRNLKNGYSQFFMELFLSLENNEIGVKKYEWLLKNTLYIKAILKSLLDLKDENLLAIYFSKLIFLCVNKNFYLPEYDLDFFITKINYFIDDEYNLNILNIICSQIINLLNVNKEIINLVLNKCKIIDNFVSIMNKENYSINIQDKLIDLLENVLKINNGSYNYEFNIEINENISDANKKLYLLALNYETDISVFNTKISNVINSMDICITNKNYDNFFNLVEIIFNYILKNNDLSKINNISDENIIKLNENLVKFAKSDFSQNILSKKLIKYLYNFVYEYNKKNFSEKLENQKNDEKEKKIYKLIYSKYIIEEKALNEILKLVLMKEQNKEFIDYIIDNFCFEQFNLSSGIENNMEDKVNNNTSNEKNNTNIYINNNIKISSIKSPQLIFKLINFIYELNPNDLLFHIYSKLTQVILEFSVNIKNLLIYNIVPITLKILLNLNDTPDGDNKIIIIINFLKRIVKYFDDNSLIYYFQSIYFHLYNNLLNNSTYDCVKIVKLMDIIKNELQSDNYFYSYISITNNKNYSPFAYNLLFINDLDYNYNYNKKYNVLHFSISIKIYSYENIDEFFLVNFINNKSLSSISFLINNKKELIIKETLMNNKENKNIAIISNIDDYLKVNNFHDISLKMNIENKLIDILIDDKKVNNKSYSYNNFLFENLDLIIGYENSNNKNNCFSIIDIKNLLIVNYEAANNNIFNTFLNNEKIKSNNTLMEKFILEKREELDKLILCDINFASINITKKTTNDRFFKKFFKNKTSDIYLSYIEILNPFNENNLKKNYLYLISNTNDNIEDLFSYNYICNLQNINTNTLKTKIFYNDFNIFNSFSNYNIIDTLIGYFYLFDKFKKYKFDDLIITILEILFSLSDRRTIEYFLYENNNVNIKLKYFFVNNLGILNNNELIEKFFDISKKTKITEILDLQKKSYCYEISLDFFSEIFCDLLIFGKLKNEIQSIIIKKLFALLNEMISGKIYNNKIILVLYKLLINIYNIILYYELPVNETIIDNNNNKNTKLDILLNCVMNIFDNIEFSKNKNNNIYINIKKKTIEINNIIQNINSCMLIKINSHKVYSFLNDKNIYVNNKFLNNHIINRQIEKLSFSILNKNPFYQRPKNNNINSDNSASNCTSASSTISRIGNASLQSLNEFNDFSNNDNNYYKDTVGKCILCLYLNIFFKFNFKNIYNEIIYEKYKNIFNINLYHNFEEFRNILEIKKQDIGCGQEFAWYLSEKQGGNKIQNKFFLRKNDIRAKSEKNRKLNDDTLFTYEYFYDFLQYNKNLKKLFCLFIYDSLCIDSHFITQIFDLNSIFDINTKKNKIYPVIKETEYTNCLYVNKIHKTLSLFIINYTKDYFIILTNIFIDVDRKTLNVVYEELDKIIFFQNNSKYKEGMRNFVKLNNESIIKNFYKNDNTIIINKSKKNVHKFGYEKNYKFLFKKIYYKEIVEMHKTSHLQISNSIEITTNYGKNYFLIFPLEQRDNIFSSILKKISDIYTIKNYDLNIYNKIESRTSIRTNNRNPKTPINNFYMKYCPINYIEYLNKENSSLLQSLVDTKIKKKALTISEDFTNQKKHYHSSSNNITLKEITKNKKTKKIYTNALIDQTQLINDLSDLWCKNKINNYDYIMLLNSLSGRSLTDLTQYYIFPWLLTDFEHQFLNWVSSKIYRNLSLPIFTSGQDLNEIKTKYDLQDPIDKYHCGTFYSTHAFTCYFLIRQRPFTEIHLEIQGGEFDAADRLFIGTKEMSTISEKVQELIPAIFTLPELYINTNNYHFGKQQRNLIKVDDFQLPNWAGGDARKFTLILKKVLENKKISEKLNLWIDLIFGCKIVGNEAVKFFNTYRHACYELTKNDIEILENNGEFKGILIEKQELGYTGKQLFKKLHKKKENLNEYKEKSDMFFDTSLKLRNMKINKIFCGNKKYKIKINDILFDNNNIFNQRKYYFKGGIGSLRSIIIALNEINNNRNNIISTVPKTINKLVNGGNFIIIGKKYLTLGKNNNLLIGYENKYIQIINIINNTFAYYYLNEPGNISALTTNEKGNKIFVGFSNGNLFEYKRIDKSKKIKDNDKIIYPFISSNDINKVNFNNDILFYIKNKKSMNDINIGNNNNKELILNETHMLKKICNNNYTLNNSRIFEEITVIKFNEEHNVLIVSTIKNKIYLLSISNNDNIKVMHIITYLNKSPKKIKNIIPLSFNGDFIIYTSLNVYLFNINGVPLCELSLLTKEYESLSKIKYSVGVFIYDVILFTAHKDGSFIIWKIKNKNIFENFGERISYLYNNTKSKYFLNEYNYAYDYDFLRNNPNSSSLEDYELRRKFEIVSQISISNFSLSFMKISNDMNYMIVLDENLNVFIVGDSNEDNKNKIRSNSNIVKKNKNVCAMCHQKIKDDFFRATFVKNINNEDLILEEGEKIEPIEFVSKTRIKTESDKKLDRNSNEECNLLCEECKQKLTHTENYLYNY